MKFKFNYYHVFKLMEYKNSNETKIQEQLELMKKIR